MSANNVTKKLKTETVDGEEYCLSVGGLADLCGGVQLGEVSSMSVLLFLLVWLVSPFVELAVIIILWKENQRHKEKIRELERQQYGRQAPPHPQGQPVGRGPYAGVPGADAGGMWQRPGQPVGMPRPDSQPVAYGQWRGQPVDMPPKVLPQPKPASQPTDMPQSVWPAPQSVSQPADMPQSAWPAPQSASQPRQSAPQFTPPRPVIAVQRPGHSANVMGTAALIVGIIFVVLAGLIFSTTTWKILPDLGKVMLIGLFVLVFFGSSLIAEKKLHIHKTGNGLYLLGSIFLFLTVLAACYFRFLGSAFVLEGVNRYRVLWIGSLVTTGVWFLGMRRFCDRLFTHACLWGMTVSMVFLGLSFAWEPTDFFGFMTVYAFVLLLLEWSIERLEASPVKAKRKEPGAPGTGKLETETGETVLKGKATEDAGAVPAGQGKERRCVTWAQAFFMLREEMALFVPVHFWLFAGLCAYNGLMEMAGISQRHLFTLCAMAVTVAGMALLCTRKRPISCQWLFLASLEYFAHYTAVTWLFAQREIYAFLTVEAVAAGCFSLWLCCRRAGSERRGPLLAGSRAEGAICLSMIFVDTLAVIGLSWLGTMAPGEQLAAFAAVLLAAGALYLWGRSCRWVPETVVLLCLYLTVAAWNLGKLYHPNCPGYEVFVTGYLCLVILWSFCSQKDCRISMTVIAVILAGISGFPLSAVPLSVLAAMVMTGRKAGRELPGQDRFLCLLFLTAAFSFYRKSPEALWSLWLFAALFWAVYLFLYRRKHLWLTGVCASAMLFLPTALSGRYQITGDALYLSVAVSLLISGIVCRLFVPVVAREEGETGAWQIDFYHILSAAPLLVMTVLADPYWRLGYLLLIGLYCLQYASVKDFPGWEKVRRCAYSGAAACLLPAFWLQPFIVWPALFSLEICLLPVAAFLLFLPVIWGKSRELRDVQTVGYLLCLVILAIDGIATGQVADGLMLEGLCLLVFGWARRKSSQLWEIISVFVMFGFSAIAFYGGLYRAGLSIGLFLAGFWLSYLVFCQKRYGNYYLNLLSSLVMLPAPLALYGQYEITGDRLYTSVAISLLASAIVFRLFLPIMQKEEGEPGAWQIDFYHILIALPLLWMTVWADRYWRFGYLLLLAFYCLQYVPAKRFPGWEKVRRSALTGLEGCLLCAFWLQPYLTWPEILTLEISLLPAALLVFSLSFLWGRSEILWNVQTAVYTGMLIILAVDGIRTGKVGDALILGGVCLLTFVWAIVRSQRRWVRIAGAMIVAEALYMTKEFWFSLSWWVYLLLAGIGLLLFAAVSEKRKK
ncbi:proline-rich domain-containing protein [Lachnospiraceae bacterium JLR.KK008]